MYGSVEKTSSAAAATFPDCSAARSASSSTSSPRAALIDACAVPHLRQRLLVQEGGRLLRQRQVQGEEVGSRQDVVRRLDAVDSQLAEALARDERVIRHDAHLEAERATGDLLADPAEAEHAERLPGQLGAAVARSFPAPLLERRVGLRDVSREREEQPDRMLGRRDDGRLGRVGDDDAAASGSLDVDVVHPHAGTADHLQPICPCDQVAVELRCRTNDDRLVVADRAGQVAVRVHVDVEPLAEEVDSRLGDRLSNEDARLAQAGVRS